MCVAMLACVSGSCGFQPSMQADSVGHGHRQPSTALERKKTSKKEREDIKIKIKITSFQVVTHPSTEQAQH